MKKIFTLLCGIVFSLLITVAQEAPPQAFSYKATLKDSKGQPIVLKDINLRIAIVKDSPDGEIVYKENFITKTNRYSQVDVEIGHGNVLWGIFSAIDWSAGEYYLKVEADFKGGWNFQVISEAQLLSVPYALFAGNVATHDGDGDSQNELQNLSISGHDLSIEKGNTVTLPDEVDDADHDPMNEIQILSLEGNILTLTTGGEPINIDLTPYLDNTDNQRISVEGHMLTISGGNSVQLPDSVNDADHDPANELQVLSIRNDTIFLSRGGYVRLPDQVSFDYVERLETRITFLEDVLLGAGLFVISDYDGNNYDVVRMGTQMWMADNLRTTHYKNGTPISLVTDRSLWSTIAKPAYCYYDNNENQYKFTHGALYNWYAVSSGNLCPTGWHVPNDAEWATLVSYLISNGYNYDNTTTSDKVAKSLAAASGWAVSSVEGAAGNTDYPEKRNATKFTAIPAGGRNSDGTFTTNGFGGYWWSTTESNSLFARYFYIYYSLVNVTMSQNYKSDGFSVRCVRD